MTPTLIRCPACGRPVSTAAPACPGCGQPIAAGAPVPGHDPWRSQLIRAGGLAFTASVAGKVLFALAAIAAFVAMVYFGGR